MKMVMFGSERNNDEFTEIIISIDKIEDEETKPSLTGKLCFLDVDKPLIL